MPDRRWGPSGAGALGSGLDPEIREQLNLVVRRDGVDVGLIPGFLDEADEAVAAYRACRSMYEESLPSSVRTDFDHAIAATRTLNDRINDLGGLSRQLLCEEDADALQRCHDHIGLVLELLAKAQRRAQELQATGGRLPDFPKVGLAAHVAHAIREHLNIESTTTRGGLFEEVLKVALGALRAETGTKSSDSDTDPSVRDLMRKALKAQVTRNADGVLEIDPRVD